LHYSIFDRMNKILSYIYPVTKKIESEHNGTLEITWYNGRKHLNSKNANYSYGALQKVLKFGLKKFDLTRVNSILLLGLGGGSVIETLRKDFKYSKKIIGVEIDQKIIDIAKEEFEITTDETLEIICADALDFMAATDEQFDLIIVDLFIDTRVPSQFLGIPFWEHVVKATATNGSILFNASLEKSRNNDLEQVIDFLKSNLYQTQIFEKVNGINTLVIAGGL